jgi:hypothetical protein
MPRSNQRCYAFIFSNGVEAMPSPEYSLPDILERMYRNQLALEAALMELTLLVESQGHAAAGDNIRTALETIGENAGHINQGLARLKAQGAQ